MSEKDFLSYVYKGKSMYPALKEGDRLIVTPYNGKKPQIGDIVIFSIPDKNFYIVHRIVGIKKDEFVTMGDNNVFPDPWLISCEMIKGKIVKAGSRKIACGIKGRIHRRIFRIQRFMKRIFYLLFRPIYSFFSKIRIGHLLSIHKRIKIFAVGKQYTEGFHIVLFYKNWKVATYYPDKNFWEIYPPFRIFIDKNVLKKITTILDKNLKKESGDELGISVSRNRICR